MPTFEVTFDGRTELVEAPSRGRAAYEMALRLSDAYCMKVGEAFKALRVRSTKRLTPRAAAQAEVDAFNEAHVVGAAVRYWTGLREGSGRESRTRSSAQVMCDHAVVWVEGQASCIALSHVEAT